MVSALTTFEQFLATEPVQVSLPYFILSLLLAAILSFLLAKIYVTYGTALSNRKKFAENFVLLATTTTLIITIVKSSLALSLGLVGALSIVRFRAAIKEPEELVYLFLVIAIGLGLGANQWRITLVAFIILSFFIWIRHRSHKKEDSQNLYLTVSGKSLSLLKITSILNKYCRAVHLKRFDQVRDQDYLEASFFVDFDSFAQLERVKNELNNLTKSINITYFDKSSIH